MIKSVSDFTEKVLNRDGVVLVDFFAKWCQPCKVLDNILKDFKEAAVVKIDVEDGAAIAEVYMISSLPTVVAFRDGNVIGALTGVFPKEKYLQLIGG